MSGKFAALSVGMGMGVAAGAVAVMMLPRQNAARRMAKRAAVEVEDAVAHTKSKICRAGNKIMR